MPRALRTAITLGVLSLLLVVGAAWGWAQVTKPFPGKADAPTCVDTSYSAGDKLFPQNVTISVLNASTREGLAGRTMQSFADAGFAQGDTANAPSHTNVATAEIWATATRSPAVHLVRSRLGKVRVLERQQSGVAGIVIVVGDRFVKLEKGRKSVTVRNDAVVCGPAG